MAKNKFVLEVDDTPYIGAPVEITLDISDEFKEWFKKQQGLKRWSQKRFESVMSNAIVTMIEYEKLIAEEAGCKEH